MKKNCFWLTCALILSLGAVVPARSNGLQIFSSATVPDTPGTIGTAVCLPSIGPLTSCTDSSSISNTSGEASSSAFTSYGALDASAAASAFLPNSSRASASGHFTDSFSVLSGSTDPGTFEITFITTGATASAGTHGDSSVSLQMFVGNLSATYSVAACEPACGGVTVTGLPTTVFSIDASDGETISFSANLGAEAQSSFDGSTASATDPVSVFITPPAGFTFTTASGTVYPSTLTPTPEPSSLLLLSSGLACLGAWRRKVVKLI